MQFLFDKPLIVRVLEVVTALVGVLMVYLAFVNSSDAGFAAVTVIIGIAFLAAGTLVHLRRWYAWHVMLILMIMIGAYLLICYIETMDPLWILFLMMDIFMIFSWTVKVTRSYFDATA